MKKIKKVIAGVCALSMSVSALPVTGIAAYANNSDVSIGSDDADNTNPYQFKGESDIEIPTEVFSDGAEDLPVEETEEETTEQAIEESYKCGDDASYTINADGVLTISGTGAIDDLSFYEDYNIKSVVIEEGITSVGYRAFDYCENLISVVLPESVEKIEEAAFSRCYSLESITIQNKSCEIYDGYSTIYGAALIVGYDGSTAHSYASDYSRKFSDIESGEAYYLYSTGDSSFIKITDDGVLTVSGTGKVSAPLYEPYDIMINSIIISEGIEQLDDHSLTSISYADNVSISIPSTVTYISPLAFYFDSNVKIFTIDEANTNYVYENGCLLSADKTALAMVVDGNNYKIPDSVKTISDRAFAASYGITSVIVPESVNYISATGFAYCGNLSKITILNKDCEIEDSDTAICNSCQSEYDEETGAWILTDGTYSGTICGYTGSTAEAYAIKYNRKFENAETGDIYGNCSETVRFTISGDTLNISGDGEIPQDTFRYDSSFSKVVIEEGITSIGNSAFYRCDELESVTLPESLESIGEYAFYGTDLKDIVIPSGVKTIENYSFSSCYNLESVTIENPECDIYDDYDMFCYAVIIGDIDSTAQTYAETYGRKFKDIKTGVFIGKCGESAEYTYIDGVITISGTGEVTGHAFSGDSDIRSIIFEEGITSISESAFYNLWNLNGITIPSTVTEIVPGAFGGCSSSLAVTISEDNQNYTYSNGFLMNKERTVVYSYWLDRDTVKIPSTVTEISSYAFKGSYVDVIELPENVTDISENAFADTNNIDNIIIKNPSCSIFDSKNTLAYVSNVVITGYKDSTAAAYADNYGCSFCDIETDEISGKCGSSATFTLINGVLTISGTGSINSESFNSKENIKSVIIEDGITSIGDSVFSYCENLTSVILPETLTEIGSNAFYYTHITEIVLPESVEKIDSYAFSSCYYLDSITILNKECEIYKSNSTIYYSAEIKGYSDSTAYEYAMDYGRKFTDLETGETFIKGMCNDTISYTIKDNVITISGQGALENQSDYSSLFGSNTFTDVIIEEGITSIGSKVFSSYSGIKSVIISSTVEDISASAFSNCDSIEKFTISPDNKNYSFENGFILNKDKTILVRCIILDTETVIPDSVVSIGESAFEGCGNLKNIEIPTNVASIGKFAFAGCKNLDRITILNKKCEIFDERFTICSSFEKYYYDDTYSGGAFSGVICGYGDSTASDYAFNYGRIFMNIETGEITQKGKCGENAVYEIKNGILNITGNGAMFDSPDFSNNSSITDAVVGEGIVSLGNSTFSECSSLRAVSLPSTLTAIGDKAFYDCYNLDSIIIPDSVTSIGSNAFYYCRNLSSLELPENLELIGERAFYYCRYISNVVVPESVKEIGSRAFDECYLSSIKILNPECKIGNERDTLSEDTYIYGYADSTASDYAFNYGMKFVDIETGAVRQTGKCGDNLYFSIDNGILTITGKGSMYSETLFSGNSSIYDVVIEEGLTSIGTYSFNRLSNLNSITLPASLAAVEPYAFDCCYDLEEINVVENSEYFVSVNGVLFSKNDDTLVAYPYGLSAENYNISSSVKTIASNAFLSSNTKMVTITNKECVLESGAFNKEIVICGYEGSTAEQYAYDYNMYFCDIETGITTLRGRCGDNLVYSMTNSGVLTISGTGEMYSDAFEDNDNIKSVIINKGATSIGDWSFYDCDNIETVSIPDTVESIGYRAFDDAAIKEIDIPSSVKIIGSYAFEDCWQLESVILHEGLETIGSGVFESTAIKEIEIPASVKTIDGDAFLYAYSLNKITVSKDNDFYCSVDGVLFDKDVTSVMCYPSGKTDTEYEIPETVTFIGGSKMSNSNLLKAVIKNTKCQIEDSSSFSDNTVIYGYENSTAQEYTYKYGKKFCIIGTEKIIQQGQCGDNLTYDITDGVLTISGTGLMYDSPLFSQNDSITKVFIEEGASSIGKNAFMSCEQITDVSIASTVAIIDDKAFAECNSLKSISVPSGVKTVGGRVFIDCTSLESINVADDNTNYCSIDGVLYDKSISELIWYPQKKAGDTFEIPATVTKINDYAFYNNRTIKNVTVPDSVTYIGYYSFYECYNLETINLPKALEFIGNSAFYNCNSLSSDIIIPEGMKSIGDSTFKYCRSISNVVLPESVELIDYNAFCSCYDLDIITINNRNCKIFGEESTIYSDTIICGYLNSTAYNYAFSNGRKFKNILTEEVTQKGACGANLTYEIKGNVLTITGTGEMYDYPQFSGNSEITEVVIEKGATTIGKSAFSSFDKLEKITIPDGIVRISDNAFYSCSALKNISIPESVVRIGDSAFEGCHSIEEIVLPSGLKEISSEMFRYCYNLKSVNIPDGIKKIGNSAFYECSCLVSIAIPDTVLRIESSAFSGCSSIKEITIPEAVISIGSSAFNNCSSLKSIMVPAAVEEIGNGAFAYCSELTEINVDTKNNFYASADGILYNKDKSAIIVYPSGKKDIEFTVPESVTTISSSSFSGIGNITDITFGKNVSLIQNNSVLNCKNLVNVTIENPDCIIGDVDKNDDYYSGQAIYSKMITGYSGSTAEEYSFNRNIIFRNIETGEEVLRGKCGETAEYTIKDDVLTITGSGNITKQFSPNNETDMFTCVKKVVIGDAISGINNAAFAYLPNLEDFEVSEGNTAFCVNDGILYSTDMKTLLSYPQNKIGTELIIPDSVERVNTIYSSHLEKITVGANTDFKIHNSDDESFYYSCQIYGPKINEFAVSEDNAEYKAVCGILMDKDLTTIIRVPSDLAGEVDIPDTVTYLPERCFAGCEKLTAVTLPSEIKYIPWNAFSDCTNLRSITIPDGVESIEDGAFCASGVEEIVIPESVKYIGYWSFGDCSNLKKITIMNPDIRIGDFGYEPENPEETYEDTSSFCSINNFAQFGEWDEETGEYTENIQYSYDGVICGTKDSNAQKYAQKWGYLFKDINSIDDTELNINAETVKLEPTKTFALKTNKENVTYSSSNVKVAEVSSDGIITARGEGTAEITVTDDLGQSIKVTVTVAYTQFTVNADTINLELGKTFTITSNKNKVTYVSSNPAIADVSSNGVVTAKSCGTAVITATDDSGQTINVFVIVSNTTVNIEFKLGDVDANNVIDAKDASMILAAYAGAATGAGLGLTDLEILAADVNKDSIVDAKDASTVLGYYAFTATGGKGTLEDYMKAAK